MKNNIVILSLILAFCHVHAKSQDLQPSTMTINQFDTVFFDLAAASTIGSVVEFPVYYRSDDQIVALDFNFKYNHNKLDYDTIIKMPNYLDVLSFYNTNDSTVRLTSYTSTLFYPNDSLLFKVRFNVLQAGPLCIGDIYTVNSLLNGDICTSGIVDCTSGLNDNEWLNGVTLFPNPATQFVEIQGLPTGSSHELLDALGHTIQSWIIPGDGPSNMLDLSQLSAGVYHVKIRNGNAIGYLPLVKVD